jgi:16S rRNA (uracil1498-N3)-methyltransferase
MGSSLAQIQNGFPVFFLVPSPSSLLPQPCYTVIQMHRFYVDKTQDGKAVIADKEQLHHLRDVLRLKPGDEVSLSDGAGNDYAGRVASVGKHQADLDVKLVRAARENPVKLTLAVAIPKNTRFDDIVDYLTQLDVERLIPMRTDRVVVKIDNAGAASKHQRWLKIAQSAAQQSRRSRIPEITPVTDFAKVIESSSNYDLKLIPHLSGDRKPIREILAEKPVKNVIILIGPEGDFTPEEVGSALANGFKPVSLGDTVLRVATAAIAAAGYIKFATDT